MHPGRAYLELKARAYNRTRAAADIFVVGECGDARAQSIPEFFSAGCVLRGGPCAAFDERISVLRGAVLWGELWRARANGRADG